jgi:hypothetical protein
MSWTEGKLIIDNIVNNNNNNHHHHHLHHQIIYFDVRGAQEGEN